uniref:Putative adenylate cyclase n=1 Tax=Magnetococcus massalia (strain MO-1) TaxID=451514 RepID=A0A1S7LME3_MAGMO|nr:Putative adenylate cyclase [Candidatus Magnetococcus massalia]
MALEEEIKLTALNAATLDAVLSDPAVQAVAKTPEQVDYRAVYYDTEELLLLRNQLAFRARKEAADRWRAAVKGTGGVVDGVSRRQEWEGYLSTLVQTLDAFPPGEMRNALGHLIEQAPHAPLKPLLVTDFKRRAIPLHFPNGTVGELALDEGQVEAAGKAQQLCEVELELVSGSLEPLQALAEELKLRHPLHPSPHSKFAIGLILLGLPIQ